MAYAVIQQHKFGRMYLCGWSKRWGATVCANRFVAMKFPTEDEAELARDHAATRCPQLPTAGRSIGRSSSYRPGSRAATRRPNEECRVRATQAAFRQFAPQLGRGDKLVLTDVYPGGVAMDAEAYDRAWRIEQRAEELFKCQYPSGSFARRLPQFRSSYPDPVGEYYRQLAAKELSSQ